MYVGVRLAYALYSSPKSRERCLSSNVILEAKKRADLAAQRIKVGRLCQRDGLQRQPRQDMDCSGRGRQLDAPARRRG